MTRPDDDAVRDGGVGGDGAADPHRFTTWWSAVRGRHADDVSATGVDASRPAPARASRLAVGRPVVTQAVRTVHVSSSKPTSSVPAPSPRGDTPEGTLGPYRLLETLGEGGMGVVRLGLDERGRAVAVKVLRDHVAHDPQARTRLRREFDTLARVRHPRVAPVLDVDTDGPRPYLVTRYVPGPSLDEWVREHGPLGGADLVRVGRGLAEALGAIHDVGVVHRDLKPGNVLMLDGDPVVIDFGIAHLVDDARLTSTGLVMGTPGYLPPELLAGASADEATDVWGWAATTTFAATGRHPFGRGPLDAVFHRVYRGEADLSGVDPRLRGLLAAALDPDPHRRPDRHRIAVALDAYAAGRDAVAAWADPAGRGSAAATEPVASRRAGAPGIAPEDAPTARIPQVVVRTQAQPTASAGTAPLFGGAEPAAAGWRGPGDPDSARGAAPPPARGGAPGAGGWTPAGPHGSYALSAEGAVGVDVGPGADAPTRPARGVAGVVAAAFLGFWALAASWPMVALGVLLGWCVLARTVNESAVSLLRRRQRRGVSTRGDVVRAVASSPFRLVFAAVTTTALAALAAPVVVATLFAVPLVVTVTQGVQASPLHELPLAVGGFVAGILAWWGPGGHAVRHGTRVVVRSVTPSMSSRGVLTAGLVLIAVFLALRTQADGVTPNWVPLGPPTEWNLPLPW